MSQYLRKHDLQQQKETVRLVTVARFASTAEAGWHCSRLEAAGIGAVVQGSVSRDMLGYYGSAIGDAQLQVAEQDAEKAREILGNSDDRQSPSGVSESDAPPQTWNCPRCGNRVEDSFEICWFCGADFDEKSQPVAALKLETIVCPMCGADVPTTCDECPKCGELLDQDSDDSPAPSAELAEPDVIEETLNHAWRAAVFGIVLLPPFLSIYSGILLGRYRELLSRTGRRPSRRAAITAAINAVVFCSMVVFWLLLFTVV